MLRIRRTITAQSKGKGQMSRDRDLMKGRRRDKSGTSLLRGAVTLMPSPVIRLISPTFADGELLFCRCWTRFGRVCVSGSTLESTLGVQSWHLDNVLCFVARYFNKLRVLSNAIENFRDQDVFSRMIYMLMKYKFR